MSEQTWYLSYGEGFPMLVCPLYLECRAEGTLVLTGQFTTATEIHEKIVSHNSEWHGIDRRDDDV